VPTDKVVQKAIAIILEHIYEKKIRSNSHGYRPNKGCHTALNQIDQQFNGVTYVIEGDIESCYPSVDHDIIMGILGKTIGDDKFLALLKKSLIFRWEEDGKKLQHSKKGTAQGRVVSPILSNVYLNEFDVFLQREIENFNKGKQRRKNPKYRRLQYKLDKYKTLPQNKKLVQSVRKEMRKLKSKDSMDPNFNRLYFVRYADDFVIGVAGSHAQATGLKEKVRVFLREKLKLTLCEEKTRITNITRREIEFLGVKIRRRNAEKPVKGGVRITPRLQIHAPIAELFEKARANGFFRKSKKTGKITPTNCGRLINLDQSDVLRYYNRINRGIMNYYSFVDNKKRLGSLVHGIKHSCALTLTLKYKLKHRSKVFKKYGKYLECSETGTRFWLPATFRRTREFISQEVTMVEDIFRKRWNRKFTKSNLNKSCVVCGKSPVEMHHVRKIRDLREKAAGKKSDFFTAQIAAINRKQVPLCREHHKQLHSGSMRHEDRKRFAEGVKSLKTGQ
jgi:group II intron reverse transcriptase/maturase